MTEQEIEHAKEQMKIYVDYFGGSFSDKGLIDNAKTAEELGAIFESHHSLFTDMATEAQSSLSKFKQKIGVSIY